jgi:hypothetical protein
MLMLLIQLAACSGGDENGKGNYTAAGMPEAAKEPVTITMQNPNASYTDDDLQKLYIDPVQKKFPFITLKIEKDSPGLTLEDRVASNSLPDSWQTYIVQIDSWHINGLILVIVT